MPGWKEQRDLEGAKILFIVQFFEDLKNRSRREFS